MESWLRGVFRILYTPVALIKRTDILATMKLERSAHEDREEALLW
jgi:hypothetical protein